jgi:hypothetical protein
MDRDFLNSLATELSRIVLFKHSISVPLPFKENFPIPIPLKIVGSITVYSRSWTVYLFQQTGYVLFKWSATSVQASFNPTEQTFFRSVCTLNSV